MILIIFNYSIILNIIFMYLFNIYSELSQKNRHQCGYRLLDTLRLTLGYHEHISHDRQRDVIQCFVTQLNHLVVEQHSQEIRRLQELCLDSLSLCMWELRAVFQFAAVTSLFSAPHSWVRCHDVTMRCVRVNNILGSPDIVRGVVKPG